MLIFILQRQFIDTMNPEGENAMMLNLDALRRLKKIPRMLKQERIKIGYSILQYLYNIVNILSSITQVSAH